jgi:hypothetical protein
MPNALEDFRNDRYSFLAEEAAHPDSVCGKDPPWLKHDPSLGIKRPKGNEIRAWTDAELAAFERRWPIGTKRRTAYALMLNMVSPASIPTS